MRINSTEAKLFFDLLEQHLEAKEFTSYDVTIIDSLAYFNDLISRLKIGSYDGRQFTPSCRKNDYSLKACILREIKKYKRSFISSLTK